MLKWFLNIIAVVYIYQFPKFRDLMTMFQKTLKNSVTSRPKMIAIIHMGAQKMSPKNNQERIFFIIF